MSVSAPFEKCFPLPSDPLWILPSDLAETAWSHACWPPPASMSELRDSLNAVKGLLNSLPLELWHRHTAAVNPAGHVLPRVRQHASRPELLTQAWCKFTECLNRFQLVPSSPEADDDDEALGPPTPFHSVHLCEAPGAFITALNHHLKTSSSTPNSLDWKWVGNSLNPFYEGNPTSRMINDDRFILRTRDHWIFGDDNTGDILSAKNRASLLETLTSSSSPLRGRVDLVSADGSIDCQEDPAHQEHLVSTLHVTEVVMALNVLSRGGHLVLKMFTLFETSSINIMFLIRCSFEEVFIFKPATSKEGNSEVYVVGKGYRKNLASDQLRAISSIPTSPEAAALFSRSQVPDSFVDCIHACASFFKELQCEAIKKNLNTFQQPSDIDYESLKNRVADKYIKDYKISSLSSENRIVRYDRMNLAESRNIDARIEMGTFEDKLRYAVCQADNIPVFREKLLSVRVTWHDSSSPVTWVSGSLFTFVKEILPVYGLKIEKIQSSKFCSSKMIELYDSVETFVSRHEDCSEIEMKRRKMVQTTSMRNLETLIEDSEMLKKLASIYPEITNLTKVFTFTRSHLLKRNFHEYKSILKALSESLDELSRGDHLIVQNFSCLTRLDVAIVHILVRNFDELGFVQPRGTESALFLSDFQGATKKWDEVFNSLIESLIVKDDGVQLAEVVPIHLIVRDPVYSAIVAHNILSLRERSLSLLNNVPPSIQSNK